MSARLPATTLVHPAHCACIVCMCDDFHDSKERRAQFKREWRETPIEERYDLGGEA